jgi:lysyl endopeptidase
MPWNEGPMKRKLLMCLTIGTITATSNAAFAQQQSAAGAPRQTIAIDAATGIPAGALRAPGQRRVTAAPVDQIDLGGLRPRPSPARAAGESYDMRGQAGYVEDAPGQVLDRPNWIPTDDGGRVWSIELSAPGSAALRVKLHGRWGHDGLELRVYDPVGGGAFGPYSRPRLDENGDWWTTIIFGDSIGLEFYAPPGDEPDWSPHMPAITAVAKHWADTGGTTRGLECSQEDVMCHADWIFEGRAVCRYSYIEAGDSWVCSGALLNREPSDLSPLVLTADHCIDNQTTAASIAFFWRFRTDECGSVPPTDPNDFPRNDGALLLKTRDNSDVSLLGMVEPPQGDLWLGWDNGGWTLQSDAVGIHHPGGTFQRISMGDVTAALWVTYGQNDAHVWRVGWDTGNTESGSSGSPVMDSSSRVRGQLKGGECGHGDYGRFGVSFDTLEPYIFNMASPVFVQAGAGGDQRGTSGDPFDGVFEASFCVFAGDEVRIRGGTYNENFTLWRPMTLNAENGVVRIGE